MIEGTNMNKRMHLIVWLFNVGAAWVGAQERVPNTKAASFSFRSNGVGNGTMTVYAEGSSPSVSQTTSGPATAESAMKTAWLLPGKEYSVNFQSSGVWEYWLGFTEPSGYRLYIDGVARDVNYIFIG
jgi:hypothetical protein